MIKSDDATALPLLYHLNSEPWMNVDAYTATLAEVPIPVRVPRERCVALPGAPEPGPVAQALAARRSCRRYAAHALDARVLSGLLAGAYGVLPMAAHGEGRVALRRPVPSAGALYPLELYACLARVDGVPDGVYRYQPLHHRLEPVRPPPTGAELDELLLAQAYVAQANVLLFVAAGLGRTLDKYGPRGYRYLLLEGGHVVQALCLLAHEHGLASLCIGGFRDSRVNRWLALDGVRQAVIYAAAIGWAEEGGAPA
jgi:SagB-type dehydrogenase family enzyme